MADGVRIEDDRSLWHLSQKNAPEPLSLVAPALRARTRLERLVVAVRWRCGLRMARDLPSLLSLLLLSSLSNACDKIAPSVGQVPHEPFSNRTAPHRIARVAVSPRHTLTPRLPPCSRFHRQNEFSQSVHSLSVAHEDVARTTLRTNGEERNGEPWAARLRVSEVFVSGANEWLEGRAKRVLRCEREPRYERTARRETTSREHVCVPRISWASAFPTVAASLKLTRIRT